jgi:hypothetical protein
MMTVRLVDILQQYPKSVAIQWTLESTAGYPAPTFTVERSGAQNGPWDVVATGIDNVVYTDTFENTGETEQSLFALSREVWYRVIATTTDGQVAVSDAMDVNGVIQDKTTSAQAIGITVDAHQTLPLPSTLFQANPRIEKRLQLVQNSVIRRAMIALQHFTGIELAVLKRKHFGTRCTECYDAASGHVLTSNCLNCYGTGWDGGYYPSFVTLGKVTDNATSTVLETQGITELRRARIEMLNFPRLEYEDVLAELDTGRRWEINDIEQPSLRRRRVLQFCTCTELAPTSIKFKIPAVRQSPIEAPYV